MGTWECIFSCSADHEQDWQPYPVDPYYAVYDDRTVIYISAFCISISVESSACKIMSSAIPLRKLILGYECERVFTAGVGLDLPASDVTSCLSLPFSQLVETRQRFGWLRINSRGAPNPYLSLVPFGR